MAKIKKKKLKETTNSVVYKKYLTYNFGCPKCPPNKGCNGRASNHDSRNWKRYRKHQWKVW